MFGMCIDKKAVAGVVTVAAAIWWLAPGAFASALPLLAVAICPLSMLLMMKAMQPRDEAAAQPAAADPTPVPPQSPAATPVDVD